MFKTEHPEGKMAQLTQTKVVGKYINVTTVITRTVDESFTDTRVIAHIDLFCSRAVCWSLRASLSDSSCAMLAALVFDGADGFGLWV